FVARRRGAAGGEGLPDRLSLRRLGLGGREPPAPRGVPARTARARMDRGQNIAIEFRYAEGRVDRLPGLAQELVGLKVDVIVASPTAAALAARDATRTIPIVGMSLTEPVGLGLVARSGCAPREVLHGDRRAQ